MIVALVWIFIAANISFISSEQIYYASVTWNPADKQYRIHDDYLQDAVATAAFQDSTFTTGWAYLNIKTKSQYPDQVQAYAAGLAEGYLTQDLISKAWKNTLEDYCLNDTEYCSRLKEFLDINMNYMNREINAKRATDPYFHQAALILEQLSGLEDGFRNVTKQPRTVVDTMGLMMLNLMGDLFELERILNKTKFTIPEGFGSCSALIKVLDNYEDIYFSHNSWILYNTMLRILKDYDFEFHGIPEGHDIVSGRRMTFSSRPGTLGSLDDFYLTSSGLVIVETTIDNYNKSLYKFVRPESIVLVWIRSIVANRLATNGSDWTDIFSYLNSGTYNNQWMILDYKKFQPGQKFQNDGLLWVLEQLPGYVHREDMTHVLSNQSYWPSYNVPYFKDIYNMSEIQRMVDKYGDYYSYERTSRSLIFKRDHSKVRNFPSMVSLMRYNDFKNDPLSRCNCTPPYSAINAIAARCDLNPKNGTYPFPLLGHLPLGATDLKVTSSSLFQSLQFMAINGPTHDPLPPFQWSKSDFGQSVRHEGHPDLWQFDPIIGPFP